MTEVEINPQLWNACAGITIHAPLLNSEVCYFPQGHAEQTHTNVEFDQTLRVSPYILCKVIDVKLLGNLENEVYAKIKLQPLDYNIHDEKISVDTQTVYESESPFPFPYFATNITSKLKCFFVSKTNAKAIFPPLFCAPDDISAEQKLEATDTHGNIWEFTHKYYMRNKHNQLTAGWIRLIRKKKATEGDAVVFVRSENGDLHVGIRRAMKVGKVRPEDVIQAVSAAAKREPFEVTYYPRATTSEFVVNASAVKTALYTRWRDGMRFKMAFEKSWFKGSVTSVQDVDPSHWPNSPWRKLQVKWDEEKDVLQNVKCVRSWQVQNHNILPDKYLTIANISQNLKNMFRLVGENIHAGQTSNDDNFCKIFLGSDNKHIGDLDLSDTDSYEDVKITLGYMFDDEMLDDEMSDDTASFMYKDSAGVVKRMGDESFSEFVRKAKTLTIVKAQ